MYTTHTLDPLCSHSKLSYINPPYNLSLLSTHFFLFFIHTYTHKLKLKIKHNYKSCSFLVTAVKRRRRNHATYLTSCSQFANQHSIRQLIIPNMLVSWITCSTNIPSLPPAPPHSRTTFVTSIPLSRFHWYVEKPTKLSLLFYF